MFNSNTKRIAMYVQFIVSIVSYVILVTELFLSILLYVLTGYVNLLYLCICLGFFLLTFMNLFKIFLKKWLFKKYTLELMTIVHEVKMPEKLPKVVWVYTTHNDFMGARILQSMKQTYKNFEIWISDGSDKTQYKEKIDDFIRKNTSIKLFRIGGNGSVDKGDNLSKFLKYSGVQFDYLVTTDADEVLDPNFVECNIRFFYTNKIKNLGYVSVQQSFYDTNSFFNNCFHFVTEFTINSSFYSDTTYVHFGSDSSIVSKQFIFSMGNRFPNIIEDYGACVHALRNGYYGLFSSLTCNQKFLDSSFKAHINRYTRIYCSVMRLFKVDPFDRINEKFLSSYLNNALIKILPFLLYLSIPYGFCLLFYLSYLEGFSNALPYFLSIAINFVVWLILRYFEWFKLVKFWKYIVCSIFLAPIFFFARIPYFIANAFNTIFLWKYKSFGGTFKSGKNEKQTFWKKNKHIFISLLFCILFTSILLVYDFLCRSYKFLDFNMLFFIFINSFVGFFSLCFFCAFLLNIFSLLHWKDKYNEDSFVPKVDNYLSLKKTKEQFYISHKINPQERLC